MQIKTKVGERYGRLVVIKRNLDSRFDEAEWFCKCDCGNEALVRGSLLRLGRTKSCGCLQRELMRKRQKTHGLSGTRPYKIWDAMRQRILNKKCHAYPLYGGRGLTIQKEWLTFEGFWKDMKSTYQDHLTIERVDNEKGYSKSNCRWSTNLEQQSNRRTNVYLEFEGKRKTLTQWGEELGIGRGTIRKRLKAGWSIKKSLTTKKLR